MKIATAHLFSTSPYSQSKPFISVIDKKNETSKDFEERVWRERLHVTKAGIVFIPGQSFKNSLSESAKYKSTQIPGKGKQTYTKHFEAGVSVADDLSIAIAGSEVEGEWLFVPSDGRRGGTTRVWKCFPRIEEWAGTVDFLVFDDIITADVFRETLVDAGRFIGIGRFRPRNNGSYGRFSVEKIDWQNV